MKPVLIISVLVKEEARASAKRMTVVGLRACDLSVERFQERWS